jgi:hypothetical protein
VHLKNGDRNAAIRELKTYLEAQPNGEKAERSRSLLEQLKN